MKTLNKINYADLFSGCGVTCKYKGYTVSIQNSYYTIENENEVISNGCLFHSKIGDIKKEIKAVINDIIKN